jgi:hypothetical protein
MARKLRAGNGTTGLILANGGVLTYQHVICLSSRPRADGQTYPAYNPLPSILETPTPPIIAETAEGEAIIEVRFLHNNYNSSSIADCVQTYTVDFNRNNEPTLGHVVGRLKCSGHRFLANHGDATTLKRLASRSEEPIGQSGYVRASGGADGRNLFFLEAGPRL